MDLDDVGVVQPGNGLGFPPKPFYESWVFIIEGREYFDRDVPVELGIAGPVDAGHATAADPLHHLVSPEAAARE